MLSLLAALLIGAAASIAVMWALRRGEPQRATLPSMAAADTGDAAREALVAERDAALRALGEETVRREHAEASLIQSQKLEAIGQLTGGVVHDFNNLLQAVAGNLELIARKPGDTDRVVDWSASALNAVERGRALTSRLLAFSARQKAEIGPVRLSGLVAGIKDLIERAVAPLALVQVDSIDPGLNVQADPLQLELALLNLAFNARDAMPEGGTLTISAARCSDPGHGLPAGDYVALTLADTGLGMTPDVAARAAEPLFTTKAPGKSTGMGLVMVARALDACGGALTLESAPGAGTRVTLLLRLSSGQPRRDVADDSKADIRVSLERCSIALVDDDPQVRASLADTLISAGADVQQAQDGRSGIDLVRAFAPDLLVVDFAMPDMTGADVTQRVREEYPDLPVVLVTGFADAGKLAAVAGPQVAVLWKPFEAQQLLQKAAELLKR